MQQRYVLGFTGASAAEANRFASTLAEALRAADPNIEIDRQRERSDTQDFGTTLAIVLGTSAVTAVAKGVAAWIAKNGGATLSIRRNGEEVLSARRVDSQDVAKIARAFAEKA